MTAARLSFSKPELNQIYQCFQVIEKRFLRILGGDVLVVQFVQVCFLVFVVDHGVLGAAPVFVCCLVAVAVCVKVALVTFDDVVDLTF